MTYSLQGMAFASLAAGSAGFSPPRPHHLHLCKNPLSPRHSQASSDRLPQVFHMLEDYMDLLQENICQALFNSLCNTKTDLACSCVFHLPSMRVALQNPNDGKKRLILPFDFCMASLSVPQRSGY